MEPTAGLSGLDPNSAGLTLPIPNTTFRALPTSKRRTISIDGPIVGVRRRFRSDRPSPLIRVATLSRQGQGNLGWVRRSLLPQQFVTLPERADCPQDSAGPGKCDDELSLWDSA
jgi:hypothetical protein